MPATIDPADLLANDSDIDGDTLTVSGVSSATGGSVILDGGTITFTPDCRPVRHRRRHLRLRHQRRQRRQRQRERDGRRHLHQRCASRWRRHGLGHRGHAGDHRPGQPADGRLRHRWQHADGFRRLERHRRQRRPRKRDHHLHAHCRPVRHRRRDLRLRHQRWQRRHRHRRGDGRRHLHQRCTGRRRRHRQRHERLGRNRLRRPRQRHGRGAQQPVPGFGIGQRQRRQCQRGRRQGPASRPSRRSPAPP